MPQVLHQLVHTLSYGDAISGEVLALERCLRDLGFESQIYAINVHPKYKGRALDYRDLPKNFSGSLLLHYSLGSPLNQLYREVPASSKGLIYHNLTPARWFRGVNPRVTADIEAGERELPELCKISDRLIADSKFNSAELSKLGFQSEVLELSVDPDRWSLPANSGILDLLRGDPALHVLHVGRLAPNKCVEDVIKTFYFLHHKIDRNSKLWISGIDIDTELYSYSLKRMVHEFGLEESVKFVGCLADSELMAMYQSASVYLCMSEHEGFCLPLVEAMHFGLPVLAYSGSAVTDTVGSGGILFSEKRHAEIAELINEVHKNRTLRDQLVAAGKKRVSELGFDSFKARVAELFRSAQSDAKQCISC